MLRRFSFIFVTTLLLIVGCVFFIPANTSAAGANIYNTSTSPIRVGDTIGISINVNTNGQSANSFNANFSYDSSLFTPVRGSQTGSVCSIWISSPDPNNGSASLSCGKPGGFTGTGLLATIYLSATNPGTAVFGLSGCQVLANDGNGTDITGGCTGSSTLINPDSVAGTPPPTATPTPTIKAPIPTPTPKPKTSPKPPTTPNVIGGTATPGAGGTAAPNPSAAGTTPTPSIAGPAAKELPSTSPTPSVAAGSEPNSTQQRTISTALKDIFSSLKNLTGLKSNATGVVALMLAMIPFLALAFAIVFLIYRLYMLERRRRRTLDRLFEMELSELAALEGKMDLLAEKGVKGREQYREEFKAAKENILRQLKPDYGKPADGRAPIEPAKTDKIE